MKVELMGRADAPPPRQSLCLCLCLFAYVCMHMYVEARSQVPMLFFRS